MLGREVALKLKIEIEKKLKLKIMRAPYFGVLVWIRFSGAKSVRNYEG